GVSLSSAAATVSLRDALPILVLAAGATAGGVIDWPTANAGPVSGVSGRVTANPGGAGLFAPPQGAPLSFADIFQQVAPAVVQIRSEEHTSELQSRENLVCRLL